MIAAPVVAAGLCAALLIEGPPRSLQPDERIPDVILVRQAPKLGGRLLVTVSNRANILEIMQALPSTYDQPLCACFGYYDLQFVVSTGMYRTVNYMPGDYVRDSEHITGQSSVPRRFRRIMGGLIRQHAVYD